MHIGRRIVDDDEFEISIVLREYGFYSLSEISRAIVGREDDGYEGIHRLFSDVCPEDTTEAGVIEVEKYTDQCIIAGFFCRSEES